MKNTPASSANDASDDLVAAYDGYATMLFAVAHDQFGLPEAAAADLAHEILLSLLRKPSCTTDVEQWLLGAMRIASQHYLASGRRREAL